MSDAVVHVVDDDESARESLAFLLESADFQVLTYASAPEFLVALPTAPDGCVVSTTCVGGPALAVAGKHRDPHGRAPPNPRRRSVAVIRKKTGNFLEDFQVGQVFPVPAGVMADHRAQLPLRTVIAQQPHPFGVAARQEGGL